MAHSSPRPGTVHANALPPHRGDDVLAAADRFEQSSDTTCAAQAVAQAGNEHSMRPPWIGPDRPGRHRGTWTNSTPNSTQPDAFSGCPAAPFCSSSQQPRAVVPAKHRRGRHRLQLARCTDVCACCAAALCTRGTGTCAHTSRRLVPQLQQRAGKGTAKAKPSRTASRRSQQTQHAARTADPEHPCQQAYERTAPAPRW